MRLKYLIPRQKAREEIFCFWSFMHKMQDHAPNKIYFTFFYVILVPGTKNTRISFGFKEGLQVIPTT